MAWIVENENTYWIPDTLPENTAEYRESQENKKYLTSTNVERIHPGWHYENGALVDDEYLYLNEGWRLIVDDGPVHSQPERFPHDHIMSHTKKNDISEWEEIDERTIKVTYTITYFTEEERQTYIDNLWTHFRVGRNLLLQRTDYAFVRAIETGKTVSQALLDYRQTLRDLPEAIDIYTFDENAYPSQWPARPSEDTWLEG